MSDTYVTVTSRDQLLDGEAVITSHRQNVMLLAPRYPQLRAVIDALIEMNGVREVRAAGRHLQIAIDTALTTPDTVAYYAANLLNHFQQEGSA